MPTKTATKKTTKAAKTPAPEPEVEEEEELDEVEVETEETSSKSQDVTFGASDLARHLSKGRDKPVSAREIRTLLRKMARDGSGRVNREITPGNRTRYNWSGLNDPEVKAVIKAFNAGELEADKQEKLNALKERKAAQKAETEKQGGKTAAKKTTKKAAAKPAQVVEEDDEELELEEDDSSEE